MHAEMWFSRTTIMVQYAALNSTLAADVASTSLPSASAARGSASTCRSVNWALALASSVRLLVTTKPGQGRPIKRLRKKALTFDTLGVDVGLDCWKAGPVRRRQRELRS